MNKAMTAFAFVLAFALCAKADGVVAGFTHGTSFEDRDVGLFDTEVPDPGDGFSSWSRADLSAGAVVTNYVEGVSPAYDYAARNMERGVNGCFAGENLQYLAVDIDKPLERLAVPRLHDDGVSNVLLKVANDYDGIYADTLVKLSPSVAAPLTDGSDKIIVWMRESERGGKTVTNLIVTAGHYAGSFKNVESADYEVETPTVKAGEWFRLTVCAISDITGVKFTAGQIQGGKNPGFVVYIDGIRAVANASYSIGTGYGEDWLTPAARVLIGERSLFPWLVPGGYDDAMMLSRLSFSGQGAVDDLLFTTTRPRHVDANNIFTLKWDAGVKSMRCIVSTNSVPVSTNEIDATQMPRRWDCRLSAADAVVTVTNVVYDYEHGYTNGAWQAESGCRAEGNSFVCYDANPVGRVASSRDVVCVGGEGGYETFAEAKALAKKRNPIVLELATNMIISTVGTGGYRDRYGRFSVTNGEDIVLDLMGHTLQGGGEDATIFQDGGRLRIIDSVGGGVVLPAARSSLSVQSVKYVKNSAKDAGHVLDIKAGRYAGEVKLTGGGNNRPYCGVCIVDGGSFTNIDDRGYFYLEQYVTNVATYFSLDADNYWSVAATNGFIWCGQGTNDFWTTVENWRGKEIPGRDDLAVFPRNTNDVENGWPVDFGTGVVAKRLWLDDDIFMSGTNEFSDVKVVSGKGRLVGAGTATFTGTLPDALTASGENSGKIRLGADWNGTVRISEIRAAKILKDIMWWGLPGSKVEFAGVRGYLSDKANYAVPYELVLTDAAGVSAWKNDTGYTGSTVSFPKLSGSGTFESPKNLREVLQVFQFKDVWAFVGKFNLGGKRILLGTGDVATPSAAGHFTFSDSVGVNSGLGWVGASAHFGENLYVRGKTNDVLLTFTDKASVPSVEDVTVVLLGPGLTTNECSLAVAGMNIVVTNVVKAARRTGSVDGNPVLAERIGSVAKHGGTIEIPVGSAISIDGNNVIINGRIVSTVPDYYTLNKVVRQDGSAAVSVSFNEAKVTPSLAEFSLSSGSGALITVQNAKPGLMYGLRTITSLEQDWESADVTWKLATEDTVTFEPPASAASAFYQVVVTEPEGSKGGVQ